MQNSTSSIVLVLALAPTLALAQSQTETSQFSAPDGTMYDYFGGSVALQGSVAVVSSVFDGASGTAYLINVDTGALIKKLVPNGPGASYQFGRAVAASGTTALVGDYWGESQGVAAGAVTLYDLATGTQTGRLEAPDGERVDHFGAAVDMHGTTIIVGAPFDKDNGPESGSAYLFDATTNTLLFKLLAQDGHGGDRFGSAVTVRGNLALIGAYGDSNNGHGYSGSAYLFDVTTGTQISKLTASDASQWDSFGYSVAMNDTTALISAVGADGAHQASGVAYIFDLATGTELLRIQAHDSGVSDGFGGTVALVGTTAVIGSWAHASPFEYSGAAYIFDSVTGAEIAKVQASDSASGDYFGGALAFDGSTIIAGAPGSDGLDAGAVYVFDVSGLENRGSAFCFGKGPGANCPCNGVSPAPGQGCMNSAGTGALLTATGSASITNDTFQLDVQGAVANTPGLILRGSSQLNGGKGIQMGDGLLCATGQVGRSQVQTTVNGSTTFTTFQGAGFGASSYGVGVITNYQFWYRDPANTCSGNGFNFSNAWAVGWSL